VAPIVSETEIARPPEEVFAYVTNPSRFAEWQVDATSASMKGDGLPRVGSRYATTRLIGGAVRTTTTSEITEINPPRSWAARGTGGPVRETVRYTVEPLEDDERSRVTIQLDFEGRGIGRLVVPLVVRRQARKEMPINCRNLKERLEAGNRHVPRVRGDGSPAA
jgi:uncharacterized protein YndB with AHSA1/START domain